jgi:hypothetical protein
LLTIPSVAVLFLRATKLAGLLIKTLAKPLSKRIKHEFSRSEFSRGILINIGQTIHGLTSRLTIWSQGYKVLSIKQLEEEKALVQGAEFVGETFLLLVSGGLVLYEYNNSNEKARIKEENHRAETRAAQDELQAKLKAIDVRLKALEVVVRSNSNSILSLGQQRYVAPDEKELVPLDISRREGSPPIGAAANASQSDDTKRRGIFRRKVEAAAAKIDERTLSAMQENMDHVDLESTRSDNLEDRQFAPEEAPVAVRFPDTDPEEAVQEVDPLTNAPWWKRLWPWPR